MCDLEMKTHDVIKSYQLRSYCKATFPPHLTG